LARHPKISPPGSATEPVAIYSRTGRGRHIKKLYRSSTCSCLFVHEVITPALPFVTAALGFTCRIWSVDECDLSQWAFRPIIPISRRFHPRRGCEVNCSCSGHYDGLRYQRHRTKIRHCWPVVVHERVRP